MKKNDLLYIVNSTQDRQYRHLTISLVRKARTFDRHEVYFRWQSHSPEFWDWYAGTIHIETQSPDLLVEVSRLLHKITGEGGIGTPAEIIAALEAAGIKRGVYDPRLSEHVELSKVPDPALRRYCAINIHDSCSADALATDLEAARPLLVKALVEYSPNALRDWIQRGEPIREDSSGRAPDISPLAAILGVKPELEAVPA